MLFQLLVNENQRLAKLLHFFWCAARLFQRVVQLLLVYSQAVASVGNENQRVDQLLHLFWCAVKLFQVFVNVNQSVAQLLGVLPGGVLLNENQRVAQLLRLFWCAARQCLKMRINV